MYIYECISPVLKLLSMFLFKNGNAPARPTEDGEISDGLCRSQRSCHRAPVRSAVAALNTVDEEVSVVHLANPRRRVGARVQECAVLVPDYLVESWIGSRLRVAEKGSVALLGGILVGEERVL